MTTSNSSGSGHSQDPFEEFKAQLREFFVKEIQPLLERHQSEVIEARFADIRSWVQTNTQALNVDTVASEVSQILSPRLTKQIEPLVKAISQLQGSTPANSPVQVSQDTITPESGIGKGQVLLGLVESLVDLGVTKILPAVSQWQSMKRQTAYDVQWAATLRQNDPAMAMIIAQVLNPDPLAVQLPNILAQNTMTVGSGSYLRGLQTKIDVQKLLSNGLGDGLWPGASTPTSPSPLGKPSVNPSIAPARSPTGMGGVSMQQKRGLRGRRTGAKRLSDLLI